MTLQTHELANSTIDTEMSPVAARPREMGRHAVGEILREDPTYKFVFCRHAPENSHEIAEALQDCDVLAFEATGGSPEERERRKTIYIGLLSSRLPEDVRRKALDMLAKGSDEDAFMAGVLMELAGSDKPVLLVDIEEESPDYHLLKKMKSTDHKFRSAIAENALNDELEVLLRENVAAWAEASGTRENLVVQQLEELQGHETGKIGVVMGAVHTPIQHALARSGNKTDRVFIDTSDAETNEKAHYSYLNQAMRQLRLNPGAHLDQSLVDRVLLSDMSIPMDFTVKNTMVLATVIVKTIEVVRFRLKL